MGRNMRYKKFRQRSQNDESDHQQQQQLAGCCDYIISIRGCRQQQQWPSSHIRRLAAAAFSRSSQTATNILLISLVFCWLHTTQDWLVESQPQIINFKQQQQQQQQQRQQSPNLDFASLAQLFQLQPPASSFASSSSSAGHGWAAAADPNNRTTMRFFRNNKTFASVVYANEQPANAAGLATHQLFNPQQQTNSDQQQQANQQQQRKNFLNRLINCHLVDLEKHSSDVALFELKYSIRTVDIEFGDMMRLIEACTEIARLRMPPINRLLMAVGPNGTQTSGGSPNRPLFNSAGSSIGSTNLPQPQPAMLRPLLVVGRPVPIVEPAMFAALAAAMTTSATNSSSLAAAGNSNSRPANEPPSIVSSSSNQESGKRARRRIAPQTGDGLQVMELSKDQQHRLTLGEVTPPASLVVNTKIREALQEITSYDTSDLMSIWRGILPGTNWCGMGDRATSYNDLGFESDIDICCRAHDFCPIRLSAFSSGYGLFNWSFYTRSHCRCDQNFLDCLRRAESPLASVVMKFYFAIMKTTCLHDNQTSLILSTEVNSSSSSSSKSRQGLTLGGGGSSSSSSTTTNKLLAANKLFEQLRAKLPIARAVERSQMLLTKLDTKQQAAWPQQQQQQQQQQSRSLGR